MLMKLKLSTLLISIQRQSQTDHGGCGDHIRQEESTMFAAIRDNMSSDQSEQLATQFKSAKSQVQDKWLGSVNKQS